MQSRRLVPLILLLAPLLTACSTDMRSVLAEDDSRARAIDTLVADPSMRVEVIERLLDSPDSLDALSKRIAQSDQAAGAVVDGITATDRGKAVTVSRITADVAKTRTFLSMMMATGAVGTMIGQDQASCLGLAEPFAHGNQRRTMTDLKRLGRVVDSWADEHGGVFPRCDGFEDVHGCLSSNLPAEALADLRLDDAWGRPFQYQSDSNGGSYVLVSYATDGRHDGLGRVGPTSSVDADIVYSDGKFVQWPGHIRTEEIR